MRYISTRDTEATSASFCDILLAGLAPDGGLYLPESYPSLSNDQLSEWASVLKERGYAALAARVLELFIDDIPRPDIEAICARAYRTPVFSDPEIVPVTCLSEEENLWLAHLSNGPTAAFKDMAMQLLGELFEYELERRGDWLTIVGATSGDTGSAAEYALRGRKGLSVVMLTPAGRMTPFQRAQMFSLLDENIVNVAVDGVFDDCQDLVKAVNIDAQFKQQWHVGAVNSINWARLLAQVVYYIATWLRLSERLGEDARVNVCVPSTIAMGTLDDVIGPKQLIVLSLSCMVVAGMSVFFLHNGGKIIFWTFGLVLCVFVGPTQSASRSFLGRMIPEGREGEVFGLYATTGRAVSFLAPAMYAVFLNLGRRWTPAGHDYTYWGILGIILILALGLILTLFVHPAKARLDSLQ